MLDKKWEERECMKGVKLNCPRQARTSSAMLLIDRMEGWRCWPGGRSHRWPTREPNRLLMTPEHNLNVMELRVRNGDRGNMVGRNGVKTNRNTLARQGWWIKGRWQTQIRCLWPWVGSDIGVWVLRFLFWAQWHSSLTEGGNGGRCKQPTQKMRTKSEYG